MSGALIVFEGIDGSGKSTQLLHLKDHLEATGKKVFVTREPSDGPIGSMVRKALLTDTSFDEATLALLFAADRLDHIKTIEAHLAQGEIVLCDRYLLSSLAYNSQHLTLEWVLNLNKEADARLHPTVTLLYDLPEQEAMARIEQRGEVAERYETLHQLYQIRQIYLMLAQVRTDDNVIVIGANQNEDAIHAETWEVLQDYL